MVTFIERERKDELQATLYRECAKHFSTEEQKRLYGSERDFADGDWLVNIYLIYENDYLTFDRFYEWEFSGIVEKIVNSDEEETYKDETAFCKDLVSKMIGTFCSFAHLVPDATREKIGQTLIDAISQYVDFN